MILRGKLSAGRLKERKLASGRITDLHIYILDAVRPLFTSCGIM